MGHTSIVVRRPRDCEGVAVLEVGDSPERQRFCDALVAARIAVVAVSSADGLVEGVDVAREEFGDDARLMVAATGSAVAAARRAARTAGVDGAVLVNARLGSSIRTGVPTIVFVDRDQSALRAWNRVAAWLGHATYEVIDTSLDAPMRRWIDSLDARDSLAPVARRATRRPIAVGAAAAAALVAAPLVAANPFDSGVPIDAAQIDGDSSTTPKEPKSPAVGDGAVAVPVTAIAGDGTRFVAPSAVGSLILTSGNGVRWEANTNITFATTSSASGAMAEAAWPSAVPDVTTSAGGVITVTPGDAFDGYNALFVDVPASTGTDSNSYNRTGAAPVEDPDCGGQQWIYPTIQMQGLDVSRTLYVPADGNYARWVNIVTNPTGAPISVAAGTANNLGSDSNTILTGSSNGDNVGDLTDTWVGTMQDYTGSTSNDPRLGHVVYGLGAPVPPSVSNFVPGDDNPFWVFELAVQPGETMTIMNFVTVDVSFALANAAAAELAALTPGGDGVVNGLRCLTASQLASLVNFDLPDVTVASASVNEADGTADIVFTRTTSGAAATVTFSLTDVTATAGADYEVPATLTVDFAAGATTATATVVIIDDGELEGDEIVEVAITDVTGYAQRIPGDGAGGVGTLTIVNDDAAPTTTAPATTVAPTTAAPTTVAPVTTVAPTTAAPVTTTAPVTTDAPTTVPIVAELPATGRSTGPLAFIAALLAAAGAAITSFTRRRPAR